MLNLESACDQTARRLPWNKGKLIGAKPPLLLKHVWSIRSKLRVDGRIRDLAMFNLAIDSKLRGCDVVSIKLEDRAVQLLPLSSHRAWLISPDVRIRRLPSHHAPDRLDHRCLPH
jgi:hypothetical protein